MALPPRTKRNQPTVRELAGQLPESSADGLLGAIKAAMSAAAAANSKRQSDAAAWMDAPLNSPPPSGDRAPTHETYPGHVGEVLGTGQAPGARPPLLPEVQTNSRLPDPAPPPPPVTSSVTRPKSSPGFWFVDHQTARPTSPSPVVFVSVDVGGGRSGGGLLARLRAWLKGGSQ